MINHEYLALVVYRETEKLTNDDPVLLFMASYIDTMSNPIDTLPAATLSWPTPNYLYNNDCIIKELE